MGDTEFALIHRLVRVCGLQQDVAARVVAEVLDTFQDTVDDFVSSRHEELQRQGLANEAIYEQIQSDLEGMRFRAPRLSARQIRRRIYG